MFDVLTKWLSERKSLYKECSSFLFPPLPHLDILLFCPFSSSLFLGRLGVARCTPALSPWKGPRERLRESSPPKKRAKSVKYGKELSYKGTVELNNVSKETGEITIKQKQKVQKAVQSKVTSGSSSVSSFLVALALCLAPCDLSSRVPCHVFPRPPALREVEGAKRQEQGQKVRARTRRHLSTQDDSFFLSGSSSTSSFGRPSPTTSRTWRPPGRRWGPATSGTWSRDCPWRRGLPLGPPLPRFSGHRDA